MDDSSSSPRTRPTVVEIIAGAALGFALWTLTYQAAVEAIGNARLATSDEPDEFGFPSIEVAQMSFGAGDTRIYYGQTLAALIASAVLLLGLALLWRSRRRAAPLQTCPHCLSAIPLAAAVCAHCTQRVAESVRP